MLRGVPEAVPKVYHTNLNQVNLNCEIKKFFVFGNYARV
nr:MAG TPA: hypothetical protein [Caudoviricetes sp.]